MKPNAIDNSRLRQLFSSLALAALAFVAVGCAQSGSSGGLASQGGGQVPTLGQQATSTPSLPPLLQPPVPLTGVGGTRGPASPQLASGDSSAATGPAPTPPGAATGIPAGATGGRTAFEADVDRFMLALINQERQKVGAQPLKIDERLHRAAWYHAMDMFTKGYIDHTNQQGQWGFDRARMFGFPANNDLSNNNENVADVFARSDAAALAQICMWEYSQSEGHWKNLLDPNWNVCGLGAVYRPDQAKRDSYGETKNPNCQQFGRI